MISPKKNIKQTLNNNTINNNPSIFKKCETKKEEYLSKINNTLGKQNLNLTNNNILNNLALKSTNQSFTSNCSTYFDFSPLSSSVKNESLNKISITNNNNSNIMLPPFQIAKEIKRNDFIRFKTTQDNYKNIFPKKINNSHNSQNNYLKFDIKIQENQNKIKILDQKFGENFGNNNEIQLKLYIYKDEWKKRKNGESHHEIIFDYNLEKDTEEGVVKELKEELKLNLEETEIVLNKFNLFSN